MKAKERAAAPGGARAASRAGCNCKNKRNPCLCSVQEQAERNQLTGCGQLQLWREERIGDPLSLVLAAEAQTETLGEGTVPRE